MGDTGQSRVEAAGCREIKRKAAKEDNRCNPTRHKERREETNHATFTNRSRKPASSCSTAVGSAIRVLSLAGATLTTGLVAGVFYAYAVSVTLGLAAQPDASYVATMQAINEKIQNPLFFLSFFGAVLFLLAALAVHLPKPRSSRFWLIALASALYVGGGFLLTVVVNVPLNEELARVVGDASAGELARESRLRKPVELLERCADGVLVSGVCRPRGRRLLREDRR